MVSTCFSGDIHHIRKNKTKKPPKQLTKSETFWFTLMTSWKTSKFQKLPPAVTVSSRDGHEIANNDWLLVLTNKDERKLWSHRAVNSISGNLSLDKNKDRRIETDCVVECWWIQVRKDTGLRVDVSLVHVLFYELTAPMYQVLGSISFLLDCFQKMKKSNLTVSIIYWL